MLSIGSGPANPLPRRSEGVRYRGRDFGLAGAAANQENDDEDGHRDADQPKQKEGNAAADGGLDGCGCFHRPQRVTFGWRRQPDRNLRPASVAGKKARKSASK